MHCLAVFITFSTNTHTHTHWKFHLEVIPRIEKKLDGFCLASVTFLCRFNCGERITETKRGKSESEWQKSFIDERAETLSAILTNGQNFVPVHANRSLISHGSRNSSLDLNKLTCLRGSAISGLARRPNLFSTWPTGRVKSIRRFGTFARQ